MQLADMRPELILAFLDHLEQGRKNAVRSRNLRHPLAESARLMPVTASPMPAHAGALAGLIS
jgi:hypothetical protein